MDNMPKGRPLAIDDTAKSASQTLLAFIARPDGAPVYQWRGRWRLLLTSDARVIDCYFKAVGVLLSLLRLIFE